MVRETRTMTAGISNTEQGISNREVLLHYWIFLVLCSIFSPLLLPCFCFFLVRPAPLNQLPRFMGGAINYIPLQENKNGLLEGKIVNRFIDLAGRRNTAAGRN